MQWYHEPSSHPGKCNCSLPLNYWPEIVTELQPRTNKLLNSYISTRRKILTHLSPESHPHGLQRPQIKCVQNALPCAWHDRTSIPCARTTAPLYLIWAILPLISSFLSISGSRPNHFHWNCPLCLQSCSLEYILTTRISFWKTNLITLFHFLMGIKDSPVRSG